MHNIIGGVCYAAMAYQLNELMDSKAAWFIDVTFKLLCAFLLIFIVGFPKSIIGLAQRLAEASIFLSTALLLFGVSFT
jgi:protein-S-isoprenylcysteine O-methyltransferase Ste14